MLKEAQDVQFTWFVADTPAVNADAAMQEFLGVEADRTEVNRVPTAQSPFLSSAVRVDADHEYTFRISPGRADLSIRRVSGPDQTTHGVPLVDAWRVTADVVNRLARAKLAVLGEVYRVAIVVPFYTIYKDFADAQREFSRRMAIRPFIGEVQDLSFTFNKRKKSSVVDTELNRIVRYQVVTLRNVQMGINGELTQVNNRVAPLHALEVNLDFNTVPSSVYYSPAQVISLFEEIAAEMSEIDGLPSPQDVS